MTQVTDTAGLAASLSGPGPARRIVAIAGAPGSGKSTTAEDLVHKLNQSTPGQAALFPMDGFHYDDAILLARGRRPWKGAPDTFDVGGLRATLARLRSNDEAEVAVPVFDRSIEIARAGGAIIPQAVQVIVCEGNYLLLAQAPWSGLHPLFDLTVMIEVSEDILRARLRARWVHFGLTEAEIDHKLDGNDLPNGRFVMANSIVPDLILHQSQA